MKATELRMGNYIYDRDIDFSKGGDRLVSYSKVFAISISTIDIEHDGHFTDGIPVDTIRPIPLTKEWLAKFGYKQVNELGDGATAWEKRKSRFLYFKDRGVKIAGSSHVELKYVHQLQNLYFALTGNEIDV